MLRVRPAERVQANIRNGLEVSEDVFDGRVRIKSHHPPAPQPPGPIPIPITKQTIAGNLKPRIPSVWYKSVNFGRKMSPLHEIGGRDLRKECRPTAEMASRSAKTCSTAVAALYVKAVTVLYVAKTVTVLYFGSSAKAVSVLYVDLGKECRPTDVMASRSAKTCET